MLNYVSPKAVLHSGWASVITVTTDGHLQETFLPALGDPWTTQDLSAKYGAPGTVCTPAVLVHDGYLSIYAIISSGDVQETYLPAIGEDWRSQNLSSKYGVPSANALVAPVAVDHGGYASVYTVDGSNNHLQESFLPAMSDGWSTQDLSAKYGLPSVKSAWNAWRGSTKSLSALVHPDTTGGRTWTSVFSVDVGNGHLRETYLPAVGQPWAGQDLTAKYGAAAQ